MLQNLHLLLLKYNVMSKKYSAGWQILFVLFIYLISDYFQRFYIDEIWLIG